MINVFLFGLNIFLIYLAWTHVLRPSIIDYFRDGLIEVSNDITCYYADHKIPLTCASYKNTQDLVDSYLAFTRKMSVAKVAVYFSKLEKHPSLMDWVLKNIEKDFLVDDTGLQDFIKKSRAESARMAIYCLVCSSPFMLALVASVFMLLVSWQAISFFKHKAAHGIAKILGEGVKFLETYSVTQYGKNYSAFR